MRHLFIINPKSRKLPSNANQLKKQIELYFKDFPMTSYDIHITRWSRDAVTYISNYIAKLRKYTNESIRIHSIGGTGTMFEVVNGSVGYQNIEIAGYPYGKANSFLRYFGNLKAFNNMHSQIVGIASKFDLLRWGKVYGCIYSLIGAEGYANHLGRKLIFIGLPDDVSYLIGGISRLFSDRRSQRYNLRIDDKFISDDFVSFMIASSPCYGVKMNPAVDAHPDSGNLKVYITKKTSKLRNLWWCLFYVYGKYFKIPKWEQIHGLYDASKIEISSNEVMHFSIDGECFFSTNVNLEIIPGALSFVVPQDINLSLLPKIFNYPKGGLRNA
jgi:diacylglycerol kinase family enzyme